LTPAGANSFEAVWEANGRTDSYERNSTVRRERHWPVLDENAYYGLPGHIVRAIKPHTEADPVAVLVSLLSAFGNACGRGPYIRVARE
jgi:hypothetical protein